MLPELAPSASGIPGLELTELTGFALQFLFSMLRIGGFVLSAPLFAARFIPLPVRIIISVMLAVPVVLTVPMPSPDSLSGMGAVPMVLSELAIGLSAGVLMQVLFAAAIIAGDRIANTAGLGLAAQVDPSTGSQSPVIGQFFLLFLLVIFVVEDGHLAAIGILIESYRVIPAGGGLSPQALTGTILESAGVMFSTSASLMMPVVAVLLLINGVIGAITRSAPQLNIFAFGFPLTMTATIILLFLTVPVIASALSDLVAHSLHTLFEMLEQAGPDGRR